MELRRLEPDHNRLPFTCGDDDLDEFYQEDSREGGAELLSVTYTLIINNTVALYFSISNDSIKRENVPKPAFRRLVRPISQRKRYSSMPAVKIGRFATSECMQCSGYGTKILDFLKVWFTTDNKTGCRFIVVDAYNNRKTIRFYERNGFTFLTGNDSKADTRLMYFDLIIFRDSTKSLEPGSE